MLWLEHSTTPARRSSERSTCYLDLMSMDRLTVRIRLLGDCHSLRDQVITCSRRVFDGIIARRVVARTKIGSDKIKYSSLKKLIAEWGSC